MKKKPSPKKKAASKKTAVAGDCQCRQGADGLWYRYIVSGGARRRIPPSYPTQEDCETNCS